MHKILIISLLLILLPGVNTAQNTPHKLIITYAGGYKGNLINTAAIDAHKLTHILYAFADVQRNGAHLNYSKTDDINLKRLVALKKKNPTLKIMLSVGGLGWSRNFSDMALTAQKRAMFASSCAVLVNHYKLDGIDIDWEFPGYRGEGGNIYRPEDKRNYTLLFKALRHEFDSLTQRMGHPLLITTAVDGWASHFLPHTEMNQVQRYVDYILLMAYNFNTPEKAGGHFLHSPPNWPAEGSAEGAVKAFSVAGVPPGKLVLGIGFFPAALQMVSNNHDNNTYTRRLLFKGGLARVTHLIGKAGYARYWDAKGQAPYLFNPSSKIRIAYEDEASVKAKAQFVVEQDLAGIMYWDYFSDPGQRLLNKVYETFQSSVKVEK